MCIYMCINSIRSVVRDMSHAPARVPSRVSGGRCTYARERDASKRRCSSRTRNHVLTVLTHTYARSSVSNGFPVRSREDVASKSSGNDPIAPEDFWNWYVTPLAHTTAVSLSLSHSHTHIRARAHAHMRSVVRTICSPEKFPSERRSSPLTDTTSKRPRFKRSPDFSEGRTLHSSS